MTASATPDAPRWPVRRPIALGGLALLLVLVGFGGWARFATLSGAVVARGQIEVDQNRQSIQHPTGGVVAALHVAEGDLVDTGQILLQLEGGTLHADRQIVRTRLFEASLQATRLEAERDGASQVFFTLDQAVAARETPEWQDLLTDQRDLFRARSILLRRETAQVQNTITQIQAQLDGLVAQQAAVADQLALVNADIVRQTGLLDRGLASTGPLLALERAAAELRGLQGALTARQAEAAERISQADLSIVQLLNARSEAAIADLRALRLQEEELRTRAMDLDRQIAALSLRAPVAGTVHGLTVFGPQAVLRPADPVAFLVPNGRPLVISAQVPVLDIEQVFTGQAARVRFPAFDLRSTPELSAVVTKVSADSFVDGRVGLPFYRIELVLEEGEAAAFLPRRLMPGMPAEVYLRTQDRTPWSYLTAPIATYFGRALRES